MIARSKSALHFAYYTNQDPCLWWPALTKGLFGGRPYLAAEEEDPGEAGGADAAPDDHRGGEQGPAAVDHPRSLPLLLFFFLPLVSFRGRRFYGGAVDGRDRTRERKTSRFAMDCIVYAGGPCNAMTSTQRPKVECRMLNPQKRPIPFTGSHLFLFTVLGMF
jgi:hypothetical protein